VTNQSARRPFLAPIVGATALIIDINLAWTKILSAMIVVMTCISFFPAQARAADDSSWYWGASFGNTYVDTGIRGLTASKDEDDKSYKFFAGYNLSNFFGMEIYYADLGEVSVKGNSGDIYSEDGYQYIFNVDNASLTWETVSYGYDLVFYMPLSYYWKNDFVSHFTPFLKYGGHFWDTEISATGTGVPSTRSDEKEYYSSGGIGLNIDVSEHIAVRAEYEKSKIGDDKGEYVSAGVFMKF